MSLRGSRVATTKQSKILKVILHPRRLRLLRRAEALHAMTPLKSSFVTAFDDGYDHFKALVCLEDIWQVRRQYDALTCFKEIRFSVNDLRKVIERRYFLSQPLTHIE